MSCGDILFPVQATDYEGVWIRWERRGYERHVRRRPETADWHDEIARTLADPDMVLELVGGGSGYYRRGVLPTKYWNCYLLVIVRWFGALGNIATVFPTDEVKPFKRIVRMKK